MYYVFYYLIADTTVVGRIYTVLCQYLRSTILGSQTCSLMEEGRNPDKSHGLFSSLSHLPCLLDMSREMYPGITEGRVRNAEYCISVWRKLHWLDFWCVLLPCFGMAWLRANIVVSTVLAAVWNYHFPILVIAPFEMAGVDLWPRFEYKPICCWERERESTSTTNINFTL